MPEVCFVFSRFEIQIMARLILNWHLNQRKIDDGRLMGTNNGRGIAMNQKNFINDKCQRGWKYFSQKIFQNYFIFMIL